MAYSLARKSVYRETEILKFKKIEISKNPKPTFINKQECFQYTIKVDWSKQKIIKDKGQTTKNKKSEENKNKKIIFWCSRTQEVHKKQAIYNLMELISLKIPLLLEFENLFEEINRKIEGVPIRISLPYKKSILVELTLSQIKEVKIQTEKFKIPV